MDQSSMPPKSDADQISKSPVGRNGDADAKDAADASSQRMVADRLLAALSGGNLESLAKHGRLFLSRAQPSLRRVRQPPNSVRRKSNNSRQTSKQNSNDDRRPGPQIR